MDKVYEERANEFGAAYDGWEPSEINALFVATGEWIERLTWSSDAAEAAMKAIYSEVVHGGRETVEEHPEWSWRELWESAVESNWDARILSVAMELHAFAFYGLRPDRRCLEPQGDEDLGVTISRMVEKMLGILEKVPTHWDPLHEVRKTVAAAEARIRLDTGRNVTPEQLAALAGVSLKSVKNLLAIKDGISDLRLDTQGEIPRSAALLWLNGRSDFRSSLWQTAKDVEVAPLPESTLGDVVFVPVAKDGSWFDPVSCRNQRGYTIGPKGAEVPVDDYYEALAQLARMATPYWRRPNSAGNRGIVAGASWQRREVVEIEQLRSPYAEGTRA